MIKACVSGGELRIRRMNDDDDDDDDDDNCDSARPFFSYSLNLTPGHMWNTCRYRSPRGDTL